jgi:HPt (histidine-containing phosphotransfer) domain-containing protein
MTDDAKSSIDERRLLELSTPEHGGDPALLVELIEIYLADSPPRLVELERAIAAADRVALANTAHRLRSSAASLGLPRLAAMCRSIEAADEVGHVGLHRMLAEVKVEQQTALHLLQGILARARQRLPGLAPPG